MFFVTFDQLTLFVVIWKRKRFNVK